MEYLLEDGREFGADLGWESGTEGGPDGLGGGWHRTAPCSARAIHAVMACEGSVVDTWGSGGRRLVAARGMRSPIKP